MKLLIWIEPIYIRDSKVTYAWVADRFVSALTELWQTDPVVAKQVKIFCNRATAEHIQAERNIPLLNLLLPTPDEEVRLEHAFPVWQADGYARWARHMEGKEEYSDGYLAMLQRVWSEFPFDAILHWGTSRFIKRFAETRGIVPLFAELGPVRPPFLATGVVDAFGVNGDSCLASGNISVLGSSSAQKTSSYSHFSTQRSEEREHYILFPLQTQDDANILLHNGGKDYSKEIVFAVKRAAALGWRCVVKPHPGAALSDYNRTADEALLQQLKLISGVEILGPRMEADDYRRLIGNAAGVVTFNSSVGCEASLLGTPTHVIAKAGYAPPGRFPDLETLLSGIPAGREWLVQMEDLHDVILNRYLLHIDRVFDLHHLREVATFWKRQLESSKTSSIHEDRRLISRWAKRVLRSGTPSWIAAPDSRQENPLGLGLTMDR
ncbi:hypothetical protein O9X90_17020 [Agrobacterium leguminum]|uniref:capsular polysaccharide export protein, LipB/KpsS family n=1 Tax=Agrobacterium leguminum TaxID=2792015 RepID=UPI0022B84295|nr:hypothetical protein [Agrobacterium leguminum]MCZ7934018.1 hypothetical protein [Agrobacterium leguminum]